MHSTWEPGELLLSYTLQFSSLSYFVVFSTARWNKTSECINNKHIYLTCQSNVYFAFRIDVSAFVWVINKNIFRYNSDRWNKFDYWTTYNKISQLLAILVPMYILFRISLQQLPFFTSRRTHRSWRVAGFETLWYTNFVWESSRDNWSRIMGPGYGFEKWLSEDNIQILDIYFFECGLCCWYPTGLCRVAWLTLRGCHWMCGFRLRTPTSRPAPLWNKVSISSVAHSR